MDVPTDKEITDAVLEAVTNFMPTIRRQGIPLLACQRERPGQKMRLAYHVMNRVMQEMYFETFFVKEDKRGMSGQHEFTTGHKRGIKQEKSKAEAILDASGARCDASNSIPQFTEYNRIQSSKVLVPETMDLLSTCTSDLSPVTCEAKTTDDFEDCHKHAITSERSPMFQSKIRRLNKTLTHEKEAQKDRARGFGHDDIHRMGQPKGNEPE